MVFNFFSFDKLYNTTRVYTITRCKFNYIYLKEDFCLFLARFKMLQK